jgi:hypothetical protein
VRDHGATVEFLQGHTQLKDRVLAIALPPLPCVPPHTAASKDAREELRRVEPAAATATTVITHIAGAVIRSALCGIGENLQKSRATIAFV